jgi:hypothetical protein
MPSVPTKTLPNNRTASVQSSWFDSVVNTISLGFGKNNNTCNSPTEAEGSEIKKIKIKKSDLSKPESHHHSNQESSFDETHIQSDESIREWLRNSYISPLEIQDPNTIPSPAPDPLDRFRIDVSFWSGRNFPKRSNSTGGMKFSNHNPNEGLTKKRTLTSLSPDDELILKPATSPSPHQPHCKLSKSIKTVQNSQNSKYPSLKLRSKSHHVLRKYYNPMESQPPSPLPPVTITCISPAVIRPLVPLLNVTPAAPFIISSDTTSSTAMTNFEEEGEEGSNETMGFGMEEEEVGVVKRLVEIAVRHDEEVERRCLRVGGWEGGGCRVGEGELRGVLDLEDE